ncbi:MAG: AMP-binding protein, partial [Myxococcales bacterium]|nr:AMP-binding protein [Myxococcales bacterium]
MSTQPLLLPQRFSASVRRWPTHIALDIPPGPGRPKRQTLTYAQLDAAADEIRQSLGQLPADAIVAITLKRDDPRLFAAILGVLRAGGAYTCIDPSLPDERRNQILTDAQPVAIVEPDRISLGAGSLG